MELREQTAKEAAAFYGLDWITPSNVVVTGGSKPALYASLLAIISPGDEVIVPIPAWVSYNHLIELAGGVVSEVPLTDNFDLDPDAIVGKITPRTRAILINSPHNPTSSVYSAGSLKKMADALKGTGVTVISDDIYAKLVFDDDFTPVPSCGFENIIIVNGFSKSQALTGWRIGYLIAEPAIVEGVSSLLSHITGNASVPSQHAAMAAMDNHDMPPAETTALLKHQRDLVIKAFSSIPQVKYHPPGGAFYFFIDVRAITTDSVDWCERLLMQTGVALVPGEAFSAPGFARLSFVVDEAILKPALEQIVKFVSDGVEK